MYRRTTFLGLIFFLGLIGLSATLCYAGPGVDRVKKAGVLKVGSDITYPPFEYMEGNQPVGFDVDLAQAIAKELGVKLEYINTAWDGIFAALKAGKFDMLLSGITITEERKKAFDLAFSDPYFLSGQGVAVRKDNDQIKTEADLKGKVVGVQINTTGQYAVEKIPGVKEIKKYETLPETYIDLAAGRLDAVVGDYPVIAENVKNNDKIKIVEGLKLGEPEALGIPVRASEKDLLEVVNKVIRDLKASGEYDRMVQKWFGTSQ
jgi:polar amino acid transport system substrate-binding protein